MTTPLLSLRAVHTHLGSYHILHGVDLTVHSGRVMMLMGRNGAGKTTALRTIVGHWRASAGEILYEGRRMNDVPTSQIAGEGISYVPENMGIFSALTVRDNLLLAARGAKSEKEFDQERLQWIWSLFPAVLKFWNSPAGTLSGGQKQMVAIARAIIQPRRLLIIDEPSKGLAPVMVGNLISALLALKAQGTTILLVEQNVSFAMQLGDDVAVMENGRIVHEGSMTDFARHESLQRRLLGLSL